MLMSGQFLPVFRDSFDTQIDRLLDDAIRAVNTWSMAWSPECNMYEDENNFYVQLALPGIEPKDVEAVVERGMLSVKGERKAQPSDGLTWHMREVREGPFRCSFSLPTYVKGEPISATYSHGMLTFTFPKSETAKPRHIMIAGE